MEPINMSIIHIDEKTVLLSLLTDKEKKDYLCAKINGRVCSLNEVIDKGDYDISFLDLNNSEASRIYSASLRFLSSLACKILSDDFEIKYLYYVSRSIFATPVGKIDYLNPDFVEKLSSLMNDLIKSDIPFTTVKVSKEEAISIFKKLHFTDKIDLVKYNNEKMISLVKASYNGFDYYDCLYSPLVPSSGYISTFKIKYYSPGFILQVPRSEIGAKIPEFVDERKFAQAIQYQVTWQDITKLSTVSEINKFVKKNSPLALISISETRINDLICQIGQRISNGDSPIKLICIAGPSSSGKTSFANRVVYELMSKGYLPIRISMDDYFIPKAKLDSKVSLESVDALDMSFFNMQMDELLRGKKVTLPCYNFKTGQREKGATIQLGKNQPIIVEGIHALNSVTCNNIPNINKYKIFISPIPLVNLDNHTPISMTDMRLLRRIARDVRTRATSPVQTLKMWSSVRYGEFNYIYPTQENADFVFNSFHPYEIGAMRNIVLPMLEKIKPEDEEYLTAQRLINMVKYFIPIPFDDVPNNSLMREFLGGSVFKDAR